MIFVYALLVLILVISVFLAIYGCRDNSLYDEDAVIVLGYGIKENKLPSMLKNRLDKTVEYHRKNPDAIIIVSGGRGDGKKPSEAAVMEEYLLSEGIPSEKIIKEDKSRTTVENFKFSADIISENFPAKPSVAFISNIFHIYRSEKYAKAAGMSITHIGAKTNRYDIPWIYIRETAMVIHMFFTTERTFK